MKVMVVGLGVMGVNHTRVLRKLGAKVYTVDPHNKHAAYPTITAAPPADIACIATPPDQLSVNAAVALKLGMDVLVEKPMAVHPEDAHHLASLAEESGLKLRVGYTERFNPALLALKDHLGMVGRVRHIGLRRLGPAARGDTGVALDLASHDLDVLRFLGYEPKVLDAIGGESAVVAKLHLGGPRATLGISHQHKTKVRSMSVAGSRGMLVLDYQAQSLVFIGNERTKHIPVTKAEPLLAEWQGFLKGEGATPEDGAKALDLVAKLEAIRAVAA